MICDSNPQVSVLIPVYNREAYIGECIQSALDQTFTDLEIIVVDNASNDRTFEICQEYASRDSRVRIFQNESNIGPVRNWLRCLKEARGGYSKILFSDDLIAPEYVARTLPLLQDSTVAFVYTAAFKGEAIGEGALTCVNGKKTKYSIDEYFLLLIREQVPFSPGAAIFRTADIRKNLHDTLPTCRTHDFWRHGAGPDVLLYALTALNYMYVAALEEPLVLFREHSGSITITNANNEVSEGNRAALSWFFVKHVSNAAWCEYIVWQWVNESKKTRSWIGIFDFIKKYEGDGSLRVKIQFGVKALKILSARFWSWLICRPFIRRIHC